jgi:hypothetical protein
LPGFYENSFVKSKENIKAGVSKMKGKRILTFVVVLILVIIGWYSYQINRYSGTLQAEKQQTTLPIQDKQFTRPEIPVKNIQPKTKPTKADVADSTISDTDVTLNLDEFDMSYLETFSFSGLSQSEERKAFSLMIDEFCKWGFLHTIMADIEIQMGDIDPNNQKVIQTDNPFKAKAKIEIISPEEATRERVKIRVRLECEELGIVILNDNIYDFDTPPVVWSTDGKMLSDDVISRIRRRAFPTNGRPWNEMFTMADLHYEDFRSLQREVKDVSELMGSFDWVPLRTSTQEEETKHFKNQKQYLFLLDCVDLAHNYWFDASSGKLSTSDKAFTGASNVLKRKIVRFEQFVDTEDGKTYFPSSFFIEIQKGKNKADFGMNVQLTNVKLNEKISPEDFSVPSATVPIRY